MCHSDFVQKVQATELQVLTKRREYLNFVNQNAHLEPSSFCSLPPSPYAQWAENDPNHTSVSENCASEKAVAEKENSFFDIESG